MMLSPAVQYFLKKYRTVIENGDFAELYRKARRFLTPAEIGELSACFYEADIDPLARLDTVPPCFLYGSDIMKLTVADSIRVIGEDAFSDCKRLSEIALPAGLTHIGAYAFHRCRSLTALTVPATVTDIGAYAFDGCDRLTLLAPAGSFAAAYAEARGLTLQLT